MSNYFANKVAIVTGGGSGLGRVLCQRLASSGATVVVADIDGESAGRVAASIHESGGKAESVRVDVSIFDEVRDLVDEVVKKHGRLDFIFNNAGVLVTGDARNLSIENWKHIINVNLYGVVNGVTAAYPVMVRQGFGHIVNTASLAGLIPLPLALPYATTKHAVVGLSNTLRIEAASLGVKVTVVCPGKIGNNMKSSAHVGFDQDRTSKMLPKGIPLEDCAQIILHGVRRNKPIIVMPLMAGSLWAMWRVSHRFSMFVSRLITDRVRTRLKS